MDSYQRKQDVTQQHTNNVLRTDLASPPRLVRSRVPPPIDTLNTNISTSILVEDVGFMEDARFMEDVGFMEDARFMKLPLAMEDSRFMKHPLAMEDTRFMKRPSDPQLAMEDAPCKRLKLRN